MSADRLVTIGDAANLTDLVWDNATSAPDTVQFSRRTPDGWRDVTCAECNRLMADEDAAVNAYRCEQGGAS